MNEDQISKIIVNSSLELHREIGPGLLESVYEVLLTKLLQDQGLIVERQKSVPILFRGLQFDEGFRADMIVNNLVLIELKSIDILARVHGKQVLTYLKFSDLKLGLLINFGGELLKGNLERIVHNLPDREKPSF